MVSWIHPDPSLFSNVISAVFAGLTVVTNRQTDKTDGQTDGRTDRQTDRQRDYATYM